MSVLGLDSADTDAYTDSRTEEVYASGLGAEAECDGTDGVGVEGVFGRFWKCHGRRKGQGTKEAG